MEKIRVFISSVHKELTVEREWAKYVLNKVPSLDLFFSPVLYEHEPATSNQAIKECVELVDTCQVYVLIVGEQSGFMVNDTSITHLEFNRAVKLMTSGKMKILAFRKDGGILEPGASALLEDVRKSGIKYKKFSTPSELASELEKSLFFALQNDFNSVPSWNFGGEASAKQIIKRASNIENLPTGCSFCDLHHAIAKRMIASWDGVKPTKLTKAELRRRLLNRNHLYTNDEDAKATMAGAIVLARDPTNISGLINAYITVEYYDGDLAIADATENYNYTGPAPEIIESAVNFVSRVTRKQERIVGIRRITIHEYPVEIIREVIVNAIAHRDYESTSVKIFLRVFNNRVSVTSPGLPLAPLTPAKLREGEGEIIAVSRNPLLAQSLLHLNLMEQRGAGFRRIRASVGTTGITKLEVKASDGFLIVTLYGRGDKLGILPLPAEVRGEIPSESIVDLNHRQKRIAERLASGEKLSRAILVADYGVSSDTAYRDLKKLVENRIATRQGAGHTTRYIHPYFLDTSS